MMYMTDGEIFSTSMKNTWIGDLGTLHHITKNNSGFYDVPDINKLIGGSSGSMPATKKGNFVCVRMSLAT